MQLYVTMLFRKSQGFSRAIVPKKAKNTPAPDKSVGSRRKIHALLLFFFLMKGIFPFCVAVEILQHKAEDRGDGRGFDQVDVVGFGEKVADVCYGQILYYNGKLLESTQFL